MGSGSDGAGSPDPDGLAVRTVPVADPGDLAGQLPGPGSAAWIHHGEGLAGWGEVARITLPAGHDRFTAADKWLRALLDGAEVDDQVGLPGCGPVAFGSFTFDPASDGSVLIVPRVVLGRRGGRAWLTTMAGGPGSLPAGWPAGGAPPAGPGLIRWHDGSLSAPQWERAVAAAVDRADHRLRGAVVADRLAHRLDARRQRGFAHEAVAPHRVENVALRDDGVAVLDEIGEHVEHLGLDVHDFVAAAEREPIGVEREPREPVPHTCIVTRDGIEVR